MFKLLVVTVLLGLAAADNINKDALIRNQQEVPADAKGNFAYAYDTTNGIAAQQSGNIAGVSGKAQWISPEGIQIDLSYTADKDGYHPSGDHLPVAPAVPQEIIRGLEYIRTHTPKE